MPPVAVSPTGPVKNPFFNPSPAAPSKYGAKPDPRAIMTPHGWVDPPYTPAESAKAGAKKPVTGGAGKLAQWLATLKTANSGAKGSSGAFNPLAGMPQQTPLTAFPTFDTSSLPDGSEIPNAPAHQFTPGTAQLLDPKQYSQQQLKAYQPIIDALTKQQSGLAAGVSGANDMIDNAYAGAGNASLKGAQIIANNNTQGNQTLTDLAAKLAGVAGGDATATQAIAGATGDAQASNTRFASVAAQAQADQAAAAARDAGTAKLAYKGATDASMNDLASQIGSAKSQGALASSKGVMDALGFNSSQETAQQQRDTAKQEAWLAGQMAGPQITAGKLANDASRQSLAINKHNVGVNDWTTLNSAKRTQYTDAVTKWTNGNVAKQMIQSMQAGKTPGAELALADPAAYKSALSDWMAQNTIKGAGPAANPATLMSTTVQSLQTAYPDSSKAAIKVLANRFVQGQLNAWNAYHPKAKYASANGGFTPVK